jgi:hypothetical protein
MYEWMETNKHAVLFTVRVSSECISLVLLGRRIFIRSFRTQNGTCEITCMKLPSFLIILTSVHRFIYLAWTHLSEFLLNVQSNICTLDPFDSSLTNHRYVRVSHPAWPPCHWKQLLMNLIPHLRYRLFDPILKCTIRPLHFHSRQFQRFYHPFNSDIIFCKNANKISKITIYSISRSGQTLTN